MKNIKNIILFYFLIFFITLINCSDEKNTTTNNINLCEKNDIEEIPFTKGVNLTNWFQEDHISKINFSTYTKRDLINIKKLGANIIRLPINFHSLTKGPPDYTIQPLLLDLLDIVINWAEELKINLIIDNHSFDPSIPTDPDIDKILIKVWSQLSKHFKNRSKLIYYEILNEPHNIDPEIWDNIQQKVVKSIREIDKNHYIIVGGADFNSVYELENLFIFDDTNIIYTFHFYSPLLFTHQGANWLTPSLGNIKNIPFPYKENTNLTVPPELKNTYIEDLINNYNIDATEEKIKEELDYAINFSKKNKVKIYCGEFGVLNLYSPENDRNYWYKIVREYLEKNSIPWTIWDYKFSFGIFNKNSTELFDYDLNNNLIESLGFNKQNQKEKNDLLVYNNGFEIFTDYAGDYIKINKYTTSGFIDEYYKNSYNGLFCIELNNIDLYNNITFDFRPDINLIELVKSNYVIEFYLKCSNETSFEIRFVDTKNNLIENDHPWRICYKIDKKLYKFDGQWSKITIKLKDFYETGSWDNNQWYTHQNLFNWEEVDYFEIANEYNSLKNIQLFIDNIVILKIY